MEQTKRAETRAAPEVRAFKPALGAAESAALAAAVRSGWLGTGIYGRLFEERLAREVGVPFALATNSGTAALHLALRSLDVAGGEVLTTPVTSVATGHAILYNGAEPVFCDVEPDTGNVDPAELERRLTRRTRAIVVVHLGHACDMDAVLAVARRRGLPVVEDACACPAAGGSYKGRPLGTLGDIGCFSFGRFKGLTTLEGGAAVLRGRGRIERLRRLRRLGHAEEGGELGEVAELGFHYRMSDLSAVVGLAQLQRRVELETRLDAVLARYRRGLEGSALLRLARPKPYSTGARAYASVRVAGGRRDRLRAFLLARGIQAPDVHRPVHRYALYRRWRASLPRAERYCAETLLLPFYPGLRDREVDRVVENLRAFKG